LEAGEQLIVAGRYSLRDGMAVTLAGEGKGTSEDGRRKE